MNINEEHIIKNNIKTLRVLNEHVNRYDIIDAIKNRDIIKIYYQGDNTVNRGYRTIEPHVLGRTIDQTKSEKGKSEAGNMVVRAWQQAGASDTKNTRPEKWSPKGWWRLFRLDGISQLLPTGKQFPQKGVGAREHYNPNGDAHIDVLVQVDYEQEAGFNMTGFDSMDDPDMVKQRVSDFDPEFDKSKEFADSPENENEILKDKVNGYFDMVKQSYKKSVNDFIITKVNNKIGLDKKVNQSKYKDDEKLGSLVDVAREVNNIGADEKIPLTFIDNERRKFTNNKKREKNTTNLNPFWKN